MTARPPLMPSEMMEPTAQDIEQLVDDVVVCGECIRTWRRDYWLADIVCWAHEYGHPIMDDADIANALLSSDIDPIGRYRERAKRECRAWLTDSPDGRKVVAQWMDNQREIEDEART